MQTRAARPGLDGRQVRRRGGRTRTVAGAALLVAGLVCLAWLGYAYLGTDVLARHAYTRETGELRTRWSSATVPGTSDGSTDPELRTAAGEQLPGTAIALLRVPRFGDGYEVPVVAGTARADLARGVGHYDGTAGPGQVGNFALAGHRVTHGQPFARLLELRRGDLVVVETRAAVITYVMDGSPADLTVQPTAGWVLDPVPGRPGTTPSQALITLTTCQDLFHSPDRSVGFGHLQSVVAK